MGYLLSDPDTESVGIHNKDGPQTWVFSFLGHTYMTCTDCGLSLTDDAGVRGILGVPHNGLPP